MYLHVPKTGGTWVCRVLETLGEGKRVHWAEGAAHATIKEKDLESGKPLLPSQHACCMSLDPSILASRRVCISLRDPWSWYVSYYHYALRPDPSAPGGVSHRGALRGFGKDGNVPTFRDALLGMLGIERSSPTLFYGTNRMMDLWTELSSSNMGLYSWSTRWTLEGRGKSSGFSILRMSHLADDLLRLLEGIGYPTNPSEKVRIRSFPRALDGRASLVDQDAGAQTSRLLYQDDWKSLYDEETWEAVLEKDAWVLGLIERAEHRQGRTS